MYVILIFSGTIKIERETHGPAVTVDILTQDRRNEMATVDFSPIIRHIHGNNFPVESGWPRATSSWPSPDIIHEIRRNYAANIVAIRPFYWIYSYAEAEKEILKQCGGCRIKAHRIMKKLNKDIWCNTPHGAISSHILKVN